MDCGDAGHILVSSTAAEMLSQVSFWNSRLHDLGEVEVKHGQIIRVFNLYAPEFGNPEMPGKVKAKRKSQEVEAQTPSPIAGNAIIGQQFSHYKILKELGQGGMGVVYQAQDQRLGRFVAVKFLPEGHSSKPSTLERFLQEARTAATLNHPNICTVHDIGSFQGHNFIVMELLQGQTLKRVISERRLSPQEIVRYCMQIADALECAHLAGIIHRDIKPGNIFLTARDQIKVLDFGLARPVKRYGSAATLDVDSAATEDSNLTGPGELVGTVPDTLPEQACARPLDCRTDLFSFGVVLYEMATGTQPFRGETSAVVFEAILNRAPAPRQFDPTCHQDWKGSLLRHCKRIRRRVTSRPWKWRSDFQRALTPSGGAVSTVQVDSEREQLGEVALLYKKNVQLDEQVLNLLEGELRRSGYRVFVDRHTQIGMEWAQEVEQRVSGADAVIALLSSTAANSEMLAYELQIAHDSARKKGKPCILPVRNQF